MRRTVFLILVLVIFVPGKPVMVAEPEKQEVSNTQSVVTEVLTPEYVSPAELVKFLGTTVSGGTHTFFCDIQKQSRPVQIRFNDAANVMILTGAKEDVSVVRELMKMTDVPPRQIIIETQIIEIDQERFDDLGIDWEDLLNSSGLNLSYSYRRDKVKSSKESDGTKVSATQTQTSRDTRLSGNLRFDRFLNVISETGAGTIRNAPRIVTINNRPAKILDGERVTYVTRYSSYTNLFETQVMDAGLNLSVIPSLGKSGYVSLNITAELTTLVESISGSPVKRGQILENTAVVKDGETLLLGGLNRSVDFKTKRKVPVLGTILPFLFSREITTKTNYEIFVLLTPKVIDLRPQKLDERLEGF